MSLFTSFKKKSDYEQRLEVFVKDVFKIKVKEVALYKEAFTHKSFSKRKNTIHFERLEFLGDAILDSIVAEYLYDKYNNMNEGDLSKLKSKIVKRDSLNLIGKQTNLLPLVRHRMGKNIPDSLEGNVFEALIGAVYLDQGYLRTQKSVVKEILEKRLDLKMLENTETDYKSKLYIWSQRNNKDLQFERKEIVKGNKKQFVVELLIDGEKLGEGVAASSKKAEQKAAKLALINLNL